jgi:hypothetical protein
MRVSFVVSLALFATLAGLPACTAAPAMTGTSPCVVEGAGPAVSKAGGEDAICTAVMGELGPVLPKGAVVWVRIVARSHIVGQTILANGHRLEEIETSVSDTALRPSSFGALARALAEQIKSFRKQ